MNGHAVTFNYQLFKSRVDSDNSVTAIASEYASEYAAYYPMQINR